MTKVNFNVKLNKKETKYLTPEGKEVERVSTYKKILGDPWSKYSIGIYKGRDSAFNLLKQNSSYLESEEIFKKAFNTENKKTKDKALERGSLYHEEIEEAFKEKDYKGELEKLANRTIDGEDASNPFAKMLLSFFEENPEYEFYSSELSFTYESGEIYFGGTIDLVLVKKVKDIIVGIIVIDFKTSKQTKEERKKYPDTYLEYVLQQVAYSAPLTTEFKDVTASNYNAYIFWEDGEINHVSYGKIKYLSTLFAFGVKYQEELKIANGIIQNLLGESEDDLELP